jgi:hypothetical protein
MFTMMETGLRLGPVRIFAEIPNDHFSNFLAMKTIFLGQIFKDGSARFL